LRPGGKNNAGVDFPPVGNWGGFAEANAHGRFAREQEIYLQITRRWRNLAKPTIAEVHGKCIAGGLMLAWACDIIVASSDAEFCDPVVTMGVCGVEWFVHPWELGPRKAKELLFTADAWSADEAHRLGMVKSCGAAVRAFIVRDDAGAKDRGQAIVRAEADQRGS
jgi:enoyl-CoA hydratase